MIETLQLLRNIGTFDSVASGAQLPLNRFAEIYAENGRGKTTLSAVFRSLGSGAALPIEERKRLGASNPPHIVVTANGGGSRVFQNGVWTNTLPEIFVFDDHPRWFPPGTLLGPFIGLSQQREGAPDQILSPADRVELRRLLDYANLFHHDTNAAWQTVIINDQELLDFSRRTLAFARRA